MNCRRENRHGMQYSSALSPVQDIVVYIYVAQAVNEQGVGVEGKGQPVEWQQNEP